MTIRRRLPSVLIGTFSIFSLSVFAYLALAIWSTAGSQVGNQEQAPVINFVQITRPVGNPVTVLPSEQARQVEIDPGDRTGAAVFRISNRGEPPVAEPGEADTVGHTISAANAASPFPADTAIIEVAPTSTGPASQTGRMPVSTTTPVFKQPPPAAVMAISPTILSPGAEAGDDRRLPAPESQPLINGLPLSAFLIMPEDVITNARAIINRGKMLGRNPRAYSKVGDSTIENPNFMTAFDGGNYNLGDFNYLKEVIDYFSGSHSRQGMAVRQGMHSWSVNDPLWADNRFCNPNETPLACEIRLHNPSVIIIRLGSNDSGTPSGFEKNLRQVVDYAIERGVLPILGTKADRFEGSDINNQIIRQVAADARVPLWDFDLVARTLPASGLGPDGVHLTVYYAHDYTSPTAYRRGHGLHNLSALLVLDAVWRELFFGGQ